MADPAIRATGATPRIASLVPCLTGLPVTLGLREYLMARTEIVDALSGWAGGSSPRVIVTHPNEPQVNLALLDQMRAEFGHLPGGGLRCVSAGRGAGCRRRTA